MTLNLPKLGGISPQVFGVQAGQDSIPMPVVRPITVAPVAVPPIAMPPRKVAPDEVAPEVVDAALERGYATIADIDALGVRREECGVKWVERWMRALPPIGPAPDLGDDVGEVLPVLDSELARSSRKSTGARAGRIGGCATGARPTSR